MPQQIEIADGIQDFVLDEFVFVAQAVFVKDAIVIQNDCIVHTPAQDQVSFTEHLNITHKAECAGSRDFLQE